MRVSRVYMLYTSYRHMSLQTAVGLLDFSEMSEKFFFVLCESANSPTVQPSSSATVSGMYV